MRLVLNSLHDEVAAKLRERIFAGALAPGSFVDEPALCTELSISRTPLREALKVLVAEGLLRHEPRRGCFVAEVTESDLDNIFPVIALLEGRAAHEATRKAGGKPLPAAKVRAEPDTRTASQSAATRTSGELRHQVQRGESLTQLAKRHNITMAALVKANNLRDHNIRIGQWLTIPGQPASATSSAAITSMRAVSM